MELLRCDGLSVSYDAAPVIQNASFVVEEGDYVLVVRGKRLREIDAR